MFEYRTKGTCSSRIFFDLRNGIVYNVRFENGCNGNLNAISKLVEGKRADELISLLKNTPCGGRSTSCPDQLARALEEAVKTPKLA